MPELSALVIRVNEGVRDLGDLLAIARAEAMKRHGLKHSRVEVLEVVYIPRLDIYVAVYRTPDARGGRCKRGA